MNDVTKKKVNDLMDKMGERLVYLYDRWQDEKEYEDFQDYIDAMKKDFEKYCKEAIMSNAVFVKVGKRPFGVTYDFEGWRVVLSSNASCVKWSAKKLK
jgi:uncharacterized protein YeeX (DUF496 family)